MKTIMVKRWVIFMVFFIFAVLVYFVGTNIYRYNQDKSFLSNVFIESLTLENGTSYSIASGKVQKNNKELSPFINYFEIQKVYKLGKLYKITREDPLFGSDLNNISELKNTLSDLEKAHDELISNANFSQDVLPKLFLNNIIETSELNNKFLNEPSYSNAVSMLDKYQESQKNYYDSLNTLRSNINNYYEYTVTNKDIINIASATSTDIIYEDLTLAMRNAKELENEINYRNNLLQGGWEKGSLKNPNLVVNDITNNEEPENLLAKKDLYGTNSEDSTIEDTLYIFNTPCFNRVNTDEFLYVAELDDGEKTYKTAKSATENYYVDTSSQNRYKDKYYNKGIKWIPAPPGTTYQCNNLEYLAKMMNADTYLKNNFEILSSVSELEMLSTQDLEVINTAKKIESDFFKEEIISERNIESLTATYYNTYLVLSEYNDLNEISGEVLNSYKQIFNHQYGVENVFASLLYYSNLNKAVLDGLIDNRNENYIYTSRNAYSLTFFNFSPNVWRLEDKPKYTKNSDRIDEQDIYSTFTELIKKYPAETLRSWGIHLSEI